MAKKVTTNSSEFNFTVSKALERHIRKFAEDLQKELREQAPKGQTHNLSNSIFVRADPAISSGGGFSFSLHLNIGVDYASFVLNGTQGPYRGGIPFGGEGSGFIGGWKGARVVAIHGTKPNDEWINEAFRTVCGKYNFNVKSVRASSR